MKTKFMILFFLVFAGMSIAQPFGKHKWGPRERMEELERIKLLESLNLNEEVAVRFFTRRNDFRESQRKLMDQRDAALLDMEIAIQKEKSNEDFDYKSNIKKLQNLEKEINLKKDEFLNSLSDILTTEQIAKLIVFESKFREELRDALMRRRGPK